MHKPKEVLKEIAISIAAGGRRESPRSVETQFSDQKPKIIYPPIEYHWHLPPKGYEKQSLGLKIKVKFKKMLSYSFKLHDSFKLWNSKSMRMAIEGTRNPKDEERVESFRQLLVLEGHPLGRQFDYHTLLRFLRMRDFDVIKAKEMFLKYLKWREEFRVDSICMEFKFEELSDVKKCYPHGYHGVDRYGRPVYIERVGVVNVNSLLQITNMDRFVKYHVCEQEKTLHWRYPACSLAAKKHIASTTSILDVKDVGTTNFSKPARYLFLEIQKIDSNYYPETLNQLFIINAGSGFKVLWTAIKAFLDPRTLAKIRVLGSNYRSKLVEVIDPSNLPTFLGGSCTCSESGGCLFSDKGPWSDPGTTEILQAMIGAGEESEDIGRRRHEGKEAEVFGADARQLENVYGISRTKDINSEQQGEPSGLSQSSMAQLEAFEALLGVAKKKIETLEAALDDTKMVLQGLARHMEQLKGE